jgi:hypothetical protein
MNWLEARTQELDKCIDAAEMLLDHLTGDKANDEHKPEEDQPEKKTNKRKSMGYKDRGYP